MFLALAIACGDPPTETTTDAADGTDIQDIAAYTAACEAALGPLPTFHCDDGDPLVVTVTDAAGTREVLASDDLEDGVACDHPSGLSGCVGGSRFGVQTNADGSVFAFLCRRFDWRGPDDPVTYDDIALIGHDPVSGDTCYWGARYDGNDRPGDPPHPGSDADRAWFDNGPYWADLPELAQLRCRSCHDNDPFLATPWITRLGTLPSVPLGPYRAIAQDALVALGGPTWAGAPQLIHPDGAPCQACHRVTWSGFCELSQYATGRDLIVRPLTQHQRVYPYDRWMDDPDPLALEARFPTVDDWEQAWGAAADTIAACCDAKLPTAECWAQPPQN